MVNLLLLGVMVRLCLHLNLMLCVLLNIGIVVSVEHWRLDD